jgi:hypothetical protein
MSDAHLHAALVAFAEEAARELHAAADAGEEVPFEVEERGPARRGTLARLRRGDDAGAFYCYRPLTAQFIAERGALLARLNAFLPAVHALQARGGLEDYLRARVAQGGLPRAPRERAELALRAFLTRTFEEQTSFELRRERLDAACAELEGLVCDGRAEVVVACGLHGLVLRSAEVPMGEGLVLARADRVADAPGEAPTFAVLTWEDVPGDEDPMDHARVRIGRLVAALGLYDPAHVAASPVAWTRVAGGPWRTTMLGLEGGHAVGRCVVEPEQEDELRAFCSLVARRTPRSGELAWALRRFGLARARAGAADALTDHLLALRALLEPEGSQSGRLAGRLAALCARAGERDALARRVAETASLERAVVAGVGGVEPDELAARVAELAEHGRAILRDVLCGHLDPDLVGTADALAPVAHVAPEAAEL